MADERKTTKKAAKKEAKAPARKAEKKTAAKTDAKKTGAKKAPAKKAAKAKSAPKATAESKATGKGESKAKGKDTKATTAAKKAPAKKAAPVPSAPPVVRASARYVRIAPRKARLVADQIRGLHIEKARALLQFSSRGAAQDIHKLIDSAAANAENNHDLIGDEMRVSSITVDEGPTLRRYRPRALGRATPINKRTSHIAVALTPAED
jgi:ribosomal protein L22